MYKIEIFLNNLSPGDNEIKPTVFAISLSGANVLPESYLAYDESETDARKRSKRELRKLAQKVTQMSDNPPAGQSVGQARKHANVSVQKQTRFILQVL